MRSIVAMNPTGRVTLPAGARRSLGLAGESFFEVRVVKGAIVLRPVAIVPLGTERSTSGATRRAS